MKMIVVIKTYILVIFLISVYDKFIPKTNSNLQPQVGSDMMEKPMICYE